MSIWVYTNIECTGCGHTFSDKTVDGLNLTRNPWIRQSILDGTLNTYRCPACDQVIMLERPFTYTDLDRKQLMLVRPRRHQPAWRNAERDIEDLFHIYVANEPSRTLFDAQDLAAFKVRVVFGYAALREKLLLWDNGLDDALVELVKMTLLRDRPELVARNFQHIVVDTVDREDHLLRLILVRPDGTEPLLVDYDLDIVDELESRRYDLEASYPELFEHAFVDLRRYA